MGGAADSAAAAGVPPAAPLLDALDENGIYLYFFAMRELVFEVIQDADGGFCAECLSDTIVTEGDTWEDLRKNVQEVVRAFYFDQPGKMPNTIRLHMVRDEVLAVA